MPGVVSGRPVWDDIVHELLGRDVLEPDRRELFGRVHQLPGRVVLESDGRE
jgi:hypothetical protein